MPVEGAPLIALAASMAWGVLSILLSPCHLASVPLIVGFISEQGTVTVRRRLSLCWWRLRVFCGPVPEPERPQAIRARFSAARQERTNRDSPWLYARARERLINAKPP
jgi:hypothetical protein